MSELPLLHMIGGKSNEEISSRLRTQMVFNDSIATMYE